MSRLGVPRGPSEACEGTDTRGTGNGEGVPQGTNTEWLRKRFIAVKAAQPAPRGRALGGSPNSCMGVHKLHENTCWIMLFLRVVFMMVLNKPLQEGH